MEWVVVLAIGIVLGSMFTWFGLSLRATWKRNKDLESSIVKTRKEQREKAMKAKADSKKIRAERFRFVMQIVVFVLAVLFVSWLVYTVFFQM